MTGHDDVLTVELDELAWVQELSDSGAATGLSPADPDGSDPATTAAPTGLSHGRGAAGSGSQAAAPSHPGSPPESRSHAAALHDAVANAHRSALTAQAALQERLVRPAPRRPGETGGSAAPHPPALHPAAPRPAAPRPAAPQPTPASTFEVVGDRLVAREQSTAPPAWPRRRTAFTPLAMTDQVRLDAADLAALARGDLAAGLGVPYAQPGQHTQPALADGDPPVLTAVSRLAQRDGPVQAGSIEATCHCGDGDPVDGYLAPARRAVEVLALVAGLPLCFADCTLVEGPPPDAVPDGRAPVLTVGTGRPAVRLQAEVVCADLVPLPWLAADVRLLDADGALAARVDGLAVHAAPHPDLPLGPTVGGEVPGLLGRFNRDGVPALLSEFNIAHIADGDQAIAMGPEFGRFSEQPAVRLPSGSLLLVDRVMELSGRRGDLQGGGPARWRTEYDSPADAWYYRDTANAGMPNCVFMEFSLQAAAFLGPYLGGTLLGGADEPVLLRNLEGRATLLRDVELGGRLISQEASVTATSVTPGAVLQEFAYESSVDGEPFYRGRSLFGYFGPEALANQTGLDGGALLPTWLESHPAAASRALDVAGRRSAPGRMPSATGRLALLEHLDVVDGGGRAGLGYLHAIQDIDPTAWYFDDHFRLDPVIPGSFGVETLIQAVQEWAVDTGLDEGLDAPEFVAPVDSTLIWKYRGQFLRTDTPMTFEVHVLGVERRPGRVRVRAEGSVWKPGMRIYWVEQLVVELREPGAPPW